MFTWPQGELYNSYQFKKFCVSDLNLKRNSSKIAIGHSVNKGNHLEFYFNQDNLAIDPIIEIYANEHFGWDQNPIECP